MHGNLVLAHEIFEDLVANPERTALEVLRFLEVDLPEGVVVSAQTRKASDEVDADWIARYRSESSG